MQALDGTTCRQNCDAANRAGRRGDVEAGRGERVAPGVMRQRLVNAEPRWADGGAGAPAENLSQGQLRPSSLRAPGPRVPQAPQPAEAGEVPAGGAFVHPWSCPSVLGPRPAPTVLSWGQCPPCIVWDDADGEFWRVQDSQLSLLCCA